MGCSNSNTNDSSSKPQPPNKENKPNSKSNNAKSNGFGGSVDTDGEIKIGQENFIRGSKTKIKKDYEFKVKLGSGAFGQVYKAIHRTLGHVRAIKRLSKEVLSQQEGDQDFLQEIGILAKLDHPNIIKIFDYYVDNDYFYVVNEMASGGELYDQIINLQFFTEVNAAIIMKQLLSAIYYLHSKGYVHRDLKPENILMETGKAGDYSIKLIDFGGATSYGKQKLSEVMGTPYYIAPEVLEKKYNNKCDLWSCGVILYILLCGFPPFNGNSEDEILESVRKGKYNFDSVEWDNVSSEAKDFVKKLMEYDPKKRISAEQALQEPWLVKNTSAEAPVLKDEKKTKMAFENLKKFHAKQKLQQASIAFIVHQMSTNEHAKELREIFKAMDTSNDGRLTKDELQQGYEKYFKDSNYTEQEFADLMKMLDTDNSGYIEYEEFLRATMQMENVLTEKNLELAFNFFDEDKSGKLEPAEIKKALGITTSSESKEGTVIQKLIGEIDSNDDGVVSFEEFKELMKRVLIGK